MLGEVNRVAALIFVWHFRFLRGVCREKCPEDPVSTDIMFSIDRFPPVFILMDRHNDILQHDQPIQIFGNINEISLSGFIFRNKLSGNGKRLFCLAS